MTSTDDQNSSPSSGNTDSDSDTPPPEKGSNTIVVSEWSFFTMNTPPPYSMIVFCHQTEIDQTEPRQDYVNQGLSDFLHQLLQMETQVIDFPAGDNSIMLQEAQLQGAVDRLVEAGVQHNPGLAQTLFNLP